MLLNALIGSQTAVEDDRDQRTEQSVSGRPSNFYSVRTLANSPTHGVLLYPSPGGLQKTSELLLVRGRAQGFIGLGGLATTVHFSRSAAERVSSPLATSRSNPFSSPQSSRVLSGKFSPLLSPSVLLGKTSTLLSPRNFSGRKLSPVAKAAWNKNGGDAKKEDGDVGTVTLTVPETSRASKEIRATKDKLPRVGGHCQKIVPAVSLAELSA